MKREDYTEVKLPNGMKIFCLRKDEVKLIYEDEWIAWKQK